MFLDEIWAKLAEIGLGHDTKRTGHPDYIRVYVLQPRAGQSPVSIGRITVYRGQYSHVKWYIAGLYCTQWQFLLSTGKIVTQEDWDACLPEAKRLAAEVRDRKLQWRRDNPKPNGGNRPALAPPNPMRFMHDLLEERLNGRYAFAEVR